MVFRHAPIPRKGSGKQQQKHMKTFHILLKTVIKIIKLENQIMSFLIHEHIVIIPILLQFKLPNIS